MYNECVLIRISKRLIEPTLNGIIHIHVESKAEIKFMLRDLCIILKLKPSVFENKLISMDNTTVWFGFHIGAKFL